MGISSKEQYKQKVCEWIDETLIYRTENESETFYDVSFDIKAKQRGVQGEVIRKFTFNAAVLVEKENGKRKTRQTDRHNSK